MKGIKIKCSISQALGEWEYYIYMETSNGDAHMNCGKGYKSSKQAFEVAMGVAQEIEKGEKE